MQPIKVAFLLYPNVTQLDLTAPAQLLSMAKMKVELVARTRAPVATDSGFSILPTATIEECRAADVLCIPGGAGCHDVMDDDDQLCWAREVAQGASHVTSVCTGSLILAAAGLLDGYRATSHWLWRKWLPLFGAILADGRVVRDRNRLTGGGVTAGLDFGLALLAELRGETAAKLTQLGAEYDPEPPFKCGSPKQAGPALVDKFEQINADSIRERVARIKATAQRLKENPLTCCPPLLPLREASSR
jgi:cyclohexyl-isocyanide hydratase